ncbi:MAG: hypothetical protein NTW86_31120 [Candidatus Sumerlaeota bacterium]|nr:hypothetical protein [Candidatus Sumerlaeota bacterium]
MDEPLAISPLWLEFSGLPEWLNAEARAGAWAVFKKIVELDCQQNAIPDIVEAAPAELAQWTGLKAETVQKILVKLRRKHLIACSLGDHEEETALIQIQIPLKTPRPAAEVCKESGKAFFRPGMRLRYAYPIDEPPGDEVRLQQVVDLYFNNISMRINSFLLDELRLIARRFDLESIRRVFGRAGLNDKPELRWAVKELLKEAKDKRTIADCRLPNAD